MNFFNTIRSLFGLKVDVDDNQPIDTLDQLSSQLNEKRGELIKAQVEFDEVNAELSLKIKACDKLIEKGVKEGEFNKGVIQQRLDRLTDEFLTSIQTLSKEVNQLDKQKIELEGDILAKSIDLTSRLTKEEQQEINDIIVTWKETGLIKGEEIETHTRAIVTALDEIVKGGPGSGRYYRHKRKVTEHERERNRILSEQENDPDIHAEGGVGGKATDSYGKRLNKVDKKIQHHRSKINEIKDKEKAKEAQEKIDAENAEKERVANWDKRYAESRRSGEFKKSHEPLVIELAGKGDVEYDSPVEGHYANVIVKDKDGKILFLKRASDKVVEPDKYCLPGGHIDEGETIEQAACRELKEEANIECDFCYVIGKAKCDDGKWAFYLNTVTQHKDVALLDGESINAHWMSRDEWIEADLIFDLKNHLVAIETSSRKIKDIPDILKGEDGEELEKGKKGPGSRGGKIIGYTKTLKPIYAGKKGNDDSYRSFSDKDHGDAARIHREAGEHEQAYAHGVMEEKHKFLNDYYDRKGMTGAEQKKWAAKAKELGIDLDKADDNEGLEKAFDIDNPFYYENEEELIKGRAAAEGEERTWGGKKYKKQGGKWLPVGSGKKKGEGKGDDKDSVPKIGSTVTLKSDSDMPTSLSHLKGQKLKVTEHQKGTLSVPVYLTVRDESGEEHTINPNYVNKEGKGSGEKKQKPLSAKQLKEHVENTSTDQLKKVSKDDKHPHNDAAKRELERREKDKGDGGMEGKFNSFSDVLKEIKNNPKAQKFAQSLLEEMHNDSQNWEDMDEWIESGLSPEVEELQGKAVDFFGEKGADMLIEDAMKRVAKANYWN